MRSREPSKLSAMSANVDPRRRAAQRRARIHTLRMRVAAVAVAGFVALWAGLFVQLATGHDPGLNSDASSALVQSADPAADETRSQATATDDGDATAPAVATDGGNATAPAVATDGVVTRQS